MNLNSGDNKMNIRIKTRGLLVALTASGMLSACQPEQQQALDIIRPIKAIEIGNAKQLAGKSFPGVAKATQEVDLSFRVSGVLNKMPVKIGQEVRIGDVLAVLDQRDFEVNLANAEAGLANVKATLKNSKVEYDRVLRIQKNDPGAVSLSLVDQRQANYEQALATYTSAEAQLNSSQDQLSYATLKAPFDGVIVQRYIENFQDVRANNPVFRLVDISKIEMDINIPEKLISKLPYVQNIRATFDAFADVVIPAEVKEISNEASQSTRTYQVRVIMTPPAGIDILPGMSGQVTGEVLNQNQQTSQVVVPLSAVFSSSDGKNTQVWIYQPKTQQVSLQAVTKGSITDNGLVITKGLKAGDWLVTAGVHFLREGQKVRLLTPAGEK